MLCMTLRQGEVLSCARSWVQLRLIENDKEVSKRSFELAIPGSAEAKEAQQTRIDAAEEKKKEKEARAEARAKPRASPKPSPTPSPRESAEKEDSPPVGRGRAQPGTAAFWIGRKVKIVSGLGEGEKGEITRTGNGFYRVVTAEGSEYSKRKTEFNGAWESVQVRVCLCISMSVVWCDML